MAGNNFLQWNPTEANQENDAAYSADTQRSGGAPTGGTTAFPSATFNKLAYQVSTMVAALANFIAGEGYAAEDANLTTLTSNLTSAINAAILAALAPVGAFSTANPGYVKIPGTSIILQWGSFSFPDIPSGTPGETGSVSFGIAFPSACFGVFPGFQTASNALNNWQFATTSISPSGFNWQIQEWSTGVNPGSMAWFAIGF